MVQVHNLVDIQKCPQVLIHHKLSLEQFQDEADYWRVTVIVQKMHQKGLITEAEFYRIDKLTGNLFSTVGFSNALIDMLYIACHTRRGGASAESD